MVWRAWVRVALRGRLGRTQGGQRAEYMDYNAKAAGPESTTETNDKMPAQISQTDTHTSTQRDTQIH